MTSSSVLRPPGNAAHTFYDGFWKSAHDFLIAFRSKFLSEMHGFRDNEVFCKSDITSSWFRRQGALQAIFHDGFRKSAYDFLIAFHSNFLYGMHGFRDNEVLLPTGNDVIVISPLGGHFSQVLLTESERATPDLPTGTKPDRHYYIKFQFVWNDPEQNSY